MRENEKENDARIRFVARYYEKAIFDPDVAWRNFAGRMGIAPRKRRVAAPFYWAAAVLAVLIVAGIAVRTASGGETFVAKAGDTLFSLPDSSVVNMRKGARLEYTKDFGATERRVSMRGTIDFEVAHDGQKPFVVATPSATIKVLGTVFGVSADEQGTQLEVTSGNVLFTSADPEISFRCAAETSVRYRTGNREIEYRTPESRIVASAAANRLSFENASLDDVGNLLSQYFRVSVGVPDDERKLAFSSTFANKNIHEIIQIVNLTLDAHLSITQ